MGYALGADTDHLKTIEDIPPLVEAGYTFFTVDPGEHVDNSPLTAVTNPFHVTFGRK